MINRILVPIIALYIVLGNIPYLNASGPFTFQVAESVPFDPTGTNFDSQTDNVRDALIELQEGNVDIEFNSYIDENSQSTTSNGWVTRTGFPYTSPTLNPATYIVSWSIVVCQTDKEKEVGTRVQTRLGTSGGWSTEVGTEIRNAVSTDDGCDTRTSFFTFVIPTASVFQLRYQFGQTDDGGTATTTVASVWFIRAKQ